MGFAGGPDKCRYVTEELKEHESRLVGARDRLVELEKQAFAQLVETIAANLAALQAVAEAVATVDLVLALGEVASTRGYSRPKFDEDGDLSIVSVESRKRSTVPPDSERKTWSALPGSSEIPASVVPPTENVWRTAPVARSTRTKLKPAQTSAVAPGQ